jgi:hypothetical protein
MRKIIPLLAVFLFWPLAALAQNGQSVTFSGTPTPGHAVVSVYGGGPPTSSTVLGDAGPALNGAVTEFGITNTGTPFCINDAKPGTVGGYHQLCLGANALGGGLISYNAYGGATPLGMNVNLNGTSYPLVGSGGGNVIGPTSPVPVAGDVVLWNGGVIVKAGGTSWPVGYAGRTYICDGTSDITSALQADLNAYAAAGGGRYYMQQTGCVIGTNGNLTIPTGVFLAGNWSGGGYQANNNYTNKSFTFLLSATNSIIMSSYSGLSGVLIAREGMPAPTTLRGFISGVEAFAGTAVSCSGQTDVDIDRTAIMGFAQAIASANCDRLRVTSTRGDDTSGLSVSSCGDDCAAHDVEFWDFTTPPYVAGPQYETINVSGATNNGSGLIRLTESAVSGTPLVTGDTVVVGNVGGVPNASGRWTATVVDSTHIDLQASTWGGSYTSGGTIYLTAGRRTGTAFYFSASNIQTSRLVEYGHDTSMHIASDDDVNCVDCWFDGDTTNDPDPVPVGLLVDGAAFRNHVSHSFISSKAIPVEVNSTSGNPPSIYLVDDEIGANSGAPLVSNNGIVKLVQGFVNIVGGQLTNGAPQTNPGVYVAAAAGGCAITGTDFQGNVTQVSYATGAPLCDVSGGPGTLNSVTSSRAVGNSPPQAGFLDALSTPNNVKTAVAWNQDGVWSWKVGMPADNANFVWSTETDLSSPVFSIMSIGHLAAGVGPGIAPTVSSCGTSPSLQAGSSDTRGVINVGSGTVSSCTMTFGNAFVAGNPACTANVGVAAALYFSAITDDTITFGTTGGENMEGTQIYYSCWD